MLQTLLIVSVNIVIQVIIEDFGVSYLYTLNSDWITCDYGRQEAWT